MSNNLTKDLIELLSTNITVKPVVVDESIFADMRPGGTISKHSVTVLEREGGEINPFVANDIYLISIYIEATKKKLGFSISKEIEEYFANMYRENYKGVKYIGADIDDRTRFLGLSPDESRYIFLINITLYTEITDPLLAGGRKTISEINNYE